jgi:hypothetical protein
MDVLFHLTTLIKAHKEVGIPGLGTIYKKKSPGRYDAETHSFLPPSYLINFTSDLKEDILLTSRISKEENISADLAVSHIEEFSQNLLNQLADQHTVAFGTLGHFSTTTGSLTFSPANTQFGFEFYGLPVVKDEIAPEQDFQPIPEATAEQEAEEQEVSVEPEVKAEPEIIVQPETTVESELAAKPEAEPEKEEEPVEVQIPAITPEQLELENNNADLGDGTEVPAVVPDPPFVETVEDLQVTIPEDLDEPAEIYETEAVEEVVKQEALPPIAEKIPVVETRPVVEAVPEFYNSPAVVQDQKPPAYRMVLIAIVIICALLALAYLLKPELFTSVMPKTETPAKETTPLVQKPVDLAADSTRLADSVATADSIRISNEKAIAAIDSAKKDSILLAGKSATAVPGGIRYEILAASLLNQREADNFLAEMKKRGIPAKIADLKGRRIKITLGTFTDEQEARKQLQHLKETTKLPGIYIFPSKHTKQH